MDYLLLIVSYLLTNKTLMPQKNPWLLHLASVWKRLKPQGKSYRQAMIEGKKTYRKGKTLDEGPKKAAPKKRRRRKKKVQ